MGHFKEVFKSYSNWGILRRFLWGVTTHLDLQKSILEKYWKTFPFFLFEFFRVIVMRLNIKSSLSLNGSWSFLAFRGTGQKNTLGVQSLFKKRSKLTKFFTIFGGKIQMFENYEILLIKLSKNQKGEKFVKVQISLQFDDFFDKKFQNSDFAVFTDFYLSLLGHSVFEGSSALRASLAPLERKKSDRLYPSSCTYPFVKSKCVWTR